MARTYFTSPDYTRANAFDAIVQLSSRQLPDYYSKFTCKEKTDNIQVILGTQGGFGSAPPMIDGDNFTVRDFTTPYKRAYDIIKRGFAFAYTTLASQSDPFGLLKRRGTLMVKSIKLAMDYDAAEFLNLATNAAVTTPDGVVLASASHLYSAGTFSNILTSNPVLSYNSMSLARQAQALFINHEGDPDPRMGPYNLLVPPALEFVAKEIVKSTDRPDTADRAKNVVADPETIKIVVSPFFTSTTAWALVQASEDDNPLCMFERRGLETNVFNGLGLNDAYTYSVNAVWVKAPKDARGFVYSSGAGS